MTALILALLLTDLPRPNQPTEFSEPAKRARAALAPFKKGMKEALTAAVEKSPESAIDVCAKKAPQLAKEASKDGVVVGRSSQKLRNATNEPRAWLKPVIEELSKAPKGSEATRLVPLENGRFGYAEAIWVQPMCLTCHGDTIAPAVAAKLKAAYPKDSATGFKDGDFRGVFWAEVDAPSK